MKRRNLVLLAVLIGLALVAAVSWWTQRQTVPSVSPEGQTLKIGALLPQTGPGAVFAEYIKKGLDLAVADANATGTGEITVLYADSKNNPAEGVSAFRQLVLREAPPVVITALSSVTRAVAPLAKDNRTVVIGTAVGLPDVTAPSDYVFRIYPEAHGLAGVMARYAATKCQTAAVVYIDDDFGASGARVFRDEFAADGGEVLASEPYKIIESDFRTQWRRIDGMRPDCVWVTGYGPAYSVIVRQMRDLGVSSVLLADMTLGLPVTLQNVGEAAEGVVYVDGEMSDEFASHYRATYAEAPTSYAGYAYDIVLMLDTLLERGATSAEEIRDGLKTVEAYPGVMGPITILGTRDADLTFKLMQIQGGEPTVLN